MDSGYGVYTIYVCINRLYAALYLDIRNYIKSCDVCQRTNDAKFVKAGYELHPIPVKPVVWNMV